jgi:NAD(P)H-nitrite reductase large subunit
MADLKADDEVCHCFGVTKKQIEEAIDAGASTVEEVGEKTQAGTGCGGCIPQIEEILKAKGK